MDRSANYNEETADAVDNGVPAHNETFLELTNGSLPHNSDYVSGEETAGNIIYNIVLPTICACGIMGIILTVIVLSRKNMSTSTNCYLMGLAIADLLFLLLFSSILGISRITISHSGYYTSNIYMSYASIFLNIFLMASIWLTVMLAVERYTAICRPFLAAKMCTVVRARILIAVIFFFALICRLANFWEYQLVTAYNPVTNKTVVYVDQTELAYNNNYTMVYPWLVDGFLASILPFLLLLILNARLIWEVRKSTKYIQQNMTIAGSANNLQREELQITIMLISVIVVFFICQAPYVIYTAITSINSFSPTPAIMLFRYITMLLLTLKSAINFIIYCWFSEKFWATLKRIVCFRHCLLKGKNNQAGNYLNLNRNSGCTRDTAV